MNRNLPVFLYLVLKGHNFFYIFQRTEMQEPVVFHETCFLNKLFL